MSGCLVGWNSHPGPLLGSPKRPNSQPRLRVSPPDHPGSNPSTRRSQVWRWSQTLSVLGQGSPRVRECNISALDISVSTFSQTNLSLCWHRQSYNFSEYYSVLSMLVWVTNVQISTSSSKPVQQTHINIIFIVVVMTRSLIHTYYCHLNVFCNSMSSSQPGTTLTDNLEEQPVLNGSMKYDIPTTSTTTITTPHSPCSWQE